MEPPQTLADLRRTPPLTAGAKPLIHSKGVAPLSSGFRGRRALDRGASVWFQGPDFGFENAALYQDLAILLRRAISDGTFPPGSHLPSEHELAREYGLARSTVRRALGILADDGVIAAQQGARRTVLAQPRLHSFSRLRSFSRWARSIGEVPDGRVELLERRAATETQGRPLEWSEDRYIGDGVAFTVRNSLALSPLTRDRAVSCASPASPASSTSLPPPNCGSSRSSTSPTR